MTADWIKFKDEQPEPGQKVIMLYLDGRGIMRGQAVGRYKIDLPADKNGCLPALWVPLVYSR